MVNSYLYFKDNSCILFDRESMAFYSIPVDIGKRLCELEENEKEAMIERVLTSKRQNFCSQTKENSKNKCSRLILVLAQKCNLACRYCYADQGTYGDRCGNCMTAETARNSINKMLELFPDGINLVQFFGGEPLLNYQIIEYVCEYCGKLVEDGKMSKLPQFAIVTNGTVMNNDILRIFNKYNVNVTISLDGPQMINDQQRIYQNNSSSVFDKIVSTIDILNVNRNFNIAVEITLTQHFIDMSDDEKNAFLDFLTSKRIDSIHTVPVIDPYNSDMQIKDDDELTNCMDLITDYSLNTLMTSNPLFMFKAADFISVILSNQKKEHFCSAGVTNFAIDTQGDIYGCFMLINPERNMCMGNVNSDNVDLELFETIAMEFNNATYQSCEECKDCYLNGFCSNCVAASYSQFGVLNKPIHESCVAQRAMFERIGFHMANNNIRKHTF